MSEQDLLREIKDNIARIESRPAPTGKTILVDEESRRRIEKALGANLTTPEELASRIERAMSINVDGVPVPLTPYLLDRLKSRAIRVDFQKFIVQTVTRLLQEFAGIR